MKVFKLIFIFFISTHLTQAQVGVGTDKPQAMLDVNGDLTIHDKIYTGGNDQLLGNPGTEGQVLVSTGNNTPPMWKTLNIPKINLGDFYLIYTNAFFDETGISFGNSTSGVSLYTKNTDLASLTNWKTIDGLTQPFEVYSNTNKIYITYEAVVQVAGSGSNSGVDFACGVFVDNKLQGVRTSTARRAADASDAFATFLMVIISDQLSEGIHQAKVACTRIQNIGGYTGTFSIGTNTESNINKFVAKSSLKVEVYEVPENYVPVTE